MSVTKKDVAGPPWLFLMLHFPAERASQRVKVWRKLQKFGALTWKNSAYILPNTPANLEKFQWLAAEVRKHRGEASILNVARIEGTGTRQVTALFNEARGRDYGRLLTDLQAALRAPTRRSRAQLRALFARLSARLEEITAIDEFGCPKRKQAEILLKEFEQRLEQKAGAETKIPAPGGEFRGRTWITRPRPGVDRVGSAWLIRNFIDRRARFLFSANSRMQGDALRFDMFEGEFTHVGDHCTFETLLERFRLREPRLRRIAQIVHDADLHDAKFGHTEGQAIDQILMGWGKMGWPDQQILERGFQLYDALYLMLGT